MGNETVKTIRKVTVVGIWINAVLVALKEFCYRYTIRYGRKLNSPALMANAWHHRSVRFLYFCC